jgi:hypothetical protein
MTITKKQLLSTGMFFLCVLSYHANAQLYVGLEAGGNQNYLITNVSNLISTEYVPKDGFNIDVPIRYKLNDWFAISATPGFIQKNYQFKRTDYYSGVYEDRRNGYWQLPVSAQFSFGGKKLKGFLDLGGYAAYWGSSRRKGVMPNPLNVPGYNTPNTQTAGYTIFDFTTPYSYNEKYQFNSTSDNRFEAGIFAGVGINYSLNKKCKLFAEYKYYDALTDQQKNYQQELVPRYNETGSITVGFLYKLNPPKKKTKKSSSK